MADEEKSWALRALDLDGCPFYAKGDSLQVQLPGVYGNQLQMCSMPVATFIPIALDGEKPEGRFQSGFKQCSCRWSFSRMAKLAKPAIELEKVLTAENQMALPFLEQLPDSAARAFRERAVIRQYREGEVVLESDVTSSHFHVIAKGLARICTKGADGRVLELSVLRKGDCFGEMSILTGAATSNRVDAVEDCLTLAVSRPDFHKLLAEYPALSIILYRMLSKRIRANNVKLTQLLSPGLSGDIRIFAFVDLAQTVLNARLTGTLVLELAERRARFGFEAGRMSHASLGNLKGTQVLDEVLQWRSGSFRFHADDPAGKANLKGDTMAILLEALRRMDESKVMERSQLDLSGLPILEP